MINQPKMNSIKDVDNKIQELKVEKKKMKYHEDKKLRLRSNNCGKSNILRRVSLNFKNKLDFINKKRDENGFDNLSDPKITELIIKHLKCWKIIEEDIIHYNVGLDPEENEAEFNEK